MILDGVSNDNEIILNLNHHQFISRRTYPEVFYFKDFFHIYLKIHCQVCQNNPLSSDPHSISNKIYKIIFIIKFTYFYFIVKIVSIIILNFHSSNRS
jgi:hypothetical protein